MATIALPSKFLFSRVNSFRLRRGSITLRSKYTGKRQTLPLPYAMWMLEANLVEADGVLAGEIRAFLAALEGEKNNFRLPVPGYTRPAMGYTGNGAVLGTVAAQAQSFVIHTLPPNSVYLLKGDFFTVQDELKVITNDTISNAQGRSTVSFQPPLRKAVTVNDTTPVILQNPTCLMTAVGNDVADWQIAPPVRQSASFEAIEDIQ